MNFDSASQLRQNSIDVRIPARIVIGVTGHRKLANVPELINGVRAAIEHVQKMPPSLANTPIGLTVLTPLAEGADQLVAREVLRIIGSTMEVVLPMDKDHYFEDFQTNQSKNSHEIGSRSPTWLFVLMDSQSRRKLVHTAKIGHIHLTC